VGARNGSQITERDREVLGLLAEHRVMVLPQVAAGLGVANSTAATRLRRLHDLRLIGHEAIFREQPAAAWITRRGLNAIGSRLPPPSIDLKGYRHDIGVGWMWLAARRGAFGSVATLVSEREMRSHDLRSDRTAEPYGVALGGLDSHGRMTRHYPDLLLTTADGARLAFELELTAKSTRRLDTIMRGYAGDGRIDSALYFVPTASLERLITAAVTRAGIPDLVRIERMASPMINGAPDPGGRTTSYERTVSGERTVAGGRTVADGRTRAGERTAAPGRTLAGGRTRAGGRTAAPGRTLAGERGGLER
jgi:hypothetical protein